MRLLITCSALDLTGSSTYTVTLAHTLKKKGVEVDVITLRGGVLSSELRQAGIPVYNRLRDIRGKTYACIIGQHNSVVKAVRAAKPDTPLVFVSHGILPRPEQPPPRTTNVQRYIAVSEEVKDHIVSGHSIDASLVEVMRNFVDVERFRPIKEIREKPETILLISNRYTHGVQATVTRACQNLDLTLTIVGKENQAKNIQEQINGADIVISLGRGIIEAMSCGRAVIVYDYLGGDGMITTENIGEIRKHNFSGRRYHRNYSVEGLIQEISRYKKTMGATNRDIVLREHNACLAAEKMLNICNEARTVFRPSPVRCPRVTWFDPLVRTRIIFRVLPPDSKVGRLAQRARNVLRKAARWRVRRAT